MANNAKNLAIILFTRIPVLGKTKTRLMPFLTEAECVIVQSAFIADVYEQLANVKAQKDVFVCFTPEGNLTELQDIVADNCEFFPQVGKGLGEKMHNAICHILKKGYKRCILVGSDIPLIKSAIVEDANRILDDNDIVICPTFDGGYYLIGMKEPCEEIFYLEYGGKKVFEKTVATAKFGGKTCGFGMATMDVDYPKDLERLAECLKNEDESVCKATRKMLKNLRDF